MRTWQNDSSTTSAFDVALKLAVLVLGRELVPSLVVAGTEDTKAAMTSNILSSLSSSELSLPLVT